MKTRTFRLRNGKLPSARIAETVEILRSGGLAVFPTDTVYGLGASVFRPMAIKKIYALKGRSYKKPLPFLVAGLEQALALVEPPDARLRKVLKKYWPGPLTVVFNTSALGRWTTGGKDTLALRVPDHPVARALLRAMNSPLAVTSANRSGRREATTGAQAASIFNGKVEVLVDGGPCPGGVPSTVLDVSSVVWTLRREGAVPKADLLRYMA